MTVQFLDLFSRFHSPAGSVFRGASILKAHAEGKYFSVLERTLC